MQKTNFYENCTFEAVFLKSIRRHFLTPSGNEVFWLGWFRRNKYFNHWFTDLPPTKRKLIGARHQPFPDCDKCVMTIKWSISNDLRHMYRGKRICKNIICHPARFLSERRLDWKGKEHILQQHSTKTKHGKTSASGASEPSEGWGPGPQPVWPAGPGGAISAEKHRVRGRASRCDASWGPQILAPHSGGITIYKRINFGQLYK